MCIWKHKGIRSLLGFYLFLIRDLDLKVQSFDVNDLPDLIAGATKSSLADEVLGSSAPAEYPMAANGRRLSIPNVDHLAAAAGQAARNKGSLARMPVKPSRYYYVLENEGCWEQRSTKHFYQSRDSRRNSSYVSELIPLEWTYQLVWVLGIGKSGVELNYHAASLILLFYVGFLRSRADHPLQSSALGLTYHPASWDQTCLDMALHSSISEWAMRSLICFLLYPWRCITLVDAKFCHVLLQAECGDNWCWHGWGKEFNGLWAGRR